MKFIRPILIRLFLLFVLIMFILFVPPLLIFVSIQNIFRATTAEFSKWWPLYCALQESDIESINDFIEDLFLAIKTGKKFYGI
jgi:hypothetical protein